MKKMKKWHTVIGAGLIAVSSVLCSFQVFAQDDLQVQKKNGGYQTSWEEVSAILDKHLGIYEEPSDFAPDTRHTPDGPLMGNGSILGFLSGKSAGDGKTQTINLSRLDNFEELNENQRDVQYIGYGGIDIKRTDSEDAVCDFQMVQDMKLAQVRGVSECGFQTESWLSSKENIIISEITNLTDRPIDLDISVWTSETKKVEEGISSLDAGVDENKQLIYASRKTGSEIYDWSVNSTTAVKLLDKTANIEKVDEHTSKFSATLSADESIYMVAAVEGGKDSLTDYEDAVSKVTSYDSIEKIESAKSAHRQWWQEYWMKSYLDLDEKSDSIEKLYYGHMYQIGCALQAISEHAIQRVTTGLFPWTGSSAPDWQGDYTLNTDVERPISVAITANRLNHIENYTQVIQDYWETGKQNASNPEHLNWLVAGSKREKFTEGIRGSLYPTHIGPWGSRTEHFNSPADYFCSPSNGTMVLQPLIQYYKATLDEEYLKETLYPMVKEQANFWVDYAEEENGQYNIYGATYESETAYKNSTMDLASAKFMLGNAVVFSEHLGQDEDLCAAWKEVHDNLAPYPTKNGYYIEDERGNDPITFSCYNVYGLTYYDLVGPNSSQEEKDKILNWLKTKQEFGTSDKQTRASITAARVGFDPHIWLDKMKAGYVDCAPSDWMGIRPNNAVGDNVAGSLFSGAIMETLMQSHEGFINLFPSWYEDQEASFKNMRAYGAFIVSGSQNTWGQVEGAVIHSEKGAECSVMNPWQKQKLSMKVLKDGKEIKTTKKENNLGELYSFSTEEGADYELIPSGALPDSIAIEESEEELFIEDTLQLTLKTNTSKPVIWSSNNMEIATVKDGVVTPLQVGKVEIKASIEGEKSISDICTIHVTDNKKIPSGQMSATAESEEGGGYAASSAIDGNENTIWHSGYSGGKVQPDIPNNSNNSITIDLGGTYNVARLDYVPRQDSIPNGDILKYEIWCSAEAEGEDFIKVSEGSWSETKERKTGEFEAVECRRIRLRAMETYASSVNDKNKWISASEFYIYKVAEKAGAVTKVITDILPVHVPVGTKWEDVLPLLPEHAEVQLSNGTTKNILIDWQGDTYTGESGIIYGNLLCEGNITNPDEIRAEAEVIVEEIVEGVQLEEDSITAFQGIKKKLKVQNSTDKKLVWNSSDESVATVDDEGNLNPLAKGNTTITVRADGTDYSDSCDVTVQRNEYNYSLELPEFTESGHLDDYKPENTADGKTGGDGSDLAAFAWTSPNLPQEEPRWIVAKFPEPITINKWRVIHVDADGSGQSITKDFELQISDNGTDWISAVTINGNKNLITEGEFENAEPITSQYFRLHIVNADNYNGQWPNNIARIDEWELLYEYGDYQIKFDAGFDGQESYTQNFVYNDDPTALSENQFIRIGYHFSGWKDADGTDYTEGQKVQNLTSKRGEEIVLTAQWIPNSYVISYDANKGEGSVPESQDAVYEQRLCLADGASLVKKGCAFEGWNTSADGTGDAYGAGEEVINLAESEGDTVVLYAQWKTAEQGNVLEKLELKAPNKLEYLIGEKLDLTGMMVLAKYTDSTEKDVTGLVKVSGYDAKKTGEQVVLVTYEGMEAQFKVIVKEDDKNDDETPDVDDGGGKTDTGDNSNIVDKKQSTKTVGNSTKSNAVKTGDETSIILLVVVALTSLGIIVFISRRKRIKK